MTTVPDLTGLTEQQLMDLLAAKRQRKERDRDAYQKIVAETVPQAIARLQDVSAELAAAKRAVFELFASVLALKYDVYETTPEQREAQQTHTFTAGGLSITLGYRILEAWDDTAQDGVAKVKDFLAGMAKDADSATLVETIFRLLKQDKNGNLRANRVLELQRIADKFNDAVFSDAVKTIADAYSPRRSCWFVDAYKTNAAGERLGIPLSISAVDFPDGFEFDLGAPSQGARASSPAKEAA